jgi:hypothetical protein
VNKEIPFPSHIGKVVTQSATVAQVGERYLLSTESGGSEHRSRVGVSRRTATGTHQGQYVKLETLHTQSLPSNHDQARSIRTSLGTVETHNRVACPTAPKERVFRDGKVDTRLMPPSNLVEKKFLNQLQVGQTPGFSPLEVK